MTATKLGWRNWIILVASVLVLVVVGYSLAPDQAAARDPDGRYANSPLKGWFDSLHSGKGPCCSDADGKALSDVDWESKDGHYRVRVEDQWWDVPDDAVITEPNRVGRTMVWPVYISPLGGPLRVDIRCFMPGSMTYHARGMKARRAQQGTAACSSCFRRAPAKFWATKITGGAR